MHKDTKLTSVNVNRKKHTEFKIACIANGITFQKLVNVSMDLYLTDRKFRNIVDSK